jgi:lipoprotein-anchoring transpeptidase ErfK/SrfK
VLAGVLAVGAAAPAAAPARTISVFFLRGEQLASVRREGSGVAAAVKKLVAGPTRAETKSGFRTYVPSDTRVHSVVVANDLATVDLNPRFTSGTNAGNRLARLAQLVGTVSAAGATRVQLLIDGAKVSGAFPRIQTDRPITLALLRTPDVPVPGPRREKKGPPDKRVKQVQQRLIQLGYLPAGTADGRLGPATEEAVLALQKWERLGRTGVVDAATRSRLNTAQRPRPVGRGGVGKRAEILIDRQVALLIFNNKVVRTIAVSSGKPSTPTPPGNYHVYAKIARWWSVPFREWLPWAVPFVGGIAFHEFAIVPVYAASHGCVRQSVAVARMTYDFAEIGMPVRVIARS